MLVSTDVTNEVELITNNSGCTLLFLDGFKFMKSGESKTTIQYRCSAYVKKCRSRIVFHKSNKTVRKNEIAHNHAADMDAYHHFLKTSVLVQRFSEQ